MESISVARSSDRKVSDPRRSTDRARVRDACVSDPSVPKPYENVKRERRDAGLAAASSASARAAEAP
jgi:hypothetical protein